ncbi:MAG: hypothetical protein N3A69_17040, partial [Leptospiraceae bacterium]|nr:hypothetical protein [Leptospiraceae bacterium]
ATLKSLLPSLLLSFLLVFSQVLLAESSYVSNSFNLQVPLPFELSFHPNYTNLILQKKPLPYDSILKINSSQLLRDSEVSSSQFREMLFQTASPFTRRTYNVTFEIAKQNLAYFISLSTFENINSPISLEFVSLQVGLQYRLSLFKWLTSLSAGVKMGIQQTYDVLTERQRKLDYRTRSNFFTQGVFLNTKGFLIEGLVRLPVYESYDHEVQTRPEFFGRLGLYWYLPDKIQP